MDLKGHLVTIIVAYDPNDDANVADKDEFNTDMTELLEKISNRKEIIMMGDLNARTGWRVDDPIASSKIINTANTMYETIKKEIHEAAFEALDKQQQPRVKSNELWWYEIVEKLVEDKTMAYRKWLETDLER
ncbi:hypothetical protein ILUMI_15648 [Ignelater luminosus]|uniref:Endonuclease/exonuclease/phosphatase domain-containing protein n=1 Tax=Ignelater luminosus TaxID=2038154 RepID=A0A8K0CN98_IGNLU|nr:hypothetical protein ILUMI_15648 [Ignelater luminosus]